MSESNAYTGRLVNRQLEKLHQLFTFYQQSLEDIYEVLSCDSVLFLFVFVAANAALVMNVYHLCLSSRVLYSVFLYIYVSSMQRFTFFIRVVLVFSSFCFVPYSSLCGVFHDAALLVSY